MSDSHHNAFINASHSTCYLTEGREKTEHYMAMPLQLLHTSIVDHKVVALN